MQGDIHFISGLPRAGSTLLSAILRQNPRFRAGMTGPVGSLVDGMLRSMSMSNETAIFITDEQRRDLIKSIFSTYYADLPKGHVVFDTNRNWCARLPLITDLFPRAKVICCVRQIPWTWIRSSGLFARTSISRRASSISNRAARCIRAWKVWRPRTAWLALPGMRCAKRFAASRPPACWR
ncbi:sulfotransferase [Bradyrhizobium huanghuaihaiense]